MIRPLLVRQAFVSYDSSEFSRGGGIMNLSSESNINRLTDALPDLFGECIALPTVLGKKTSHDD